eukprot:3996572-Pyramimonas_sp.AAC.1
MLLTKPIAELPLLRVSSAGASSMRFTLYYTASAHLYLPGTLLQTKKAVDPCKLQPTSAMRLDPMSVGIMIRARYGR